MQLHKPEHRGKYHDHNLSWKERQVLHDEYQQLSTKLFEDFVNGEYDFYGVAAGTYAFKLDDEVFAARIDENDGYRSSIDDVDVLTKEEIAEQQLRFFRKPIARVRVVYTHEYSWEQYGGSGDFYQLVDVDSGHVWVCFGTDSTDSYYPSERFYYNVNERVMKVMVILDENDTD